MSDLQAETDRKNAETSAREVAEWNANPPEKYFLYINEEKATATTWTGDKLGSVLFGRAYRGGFGFSSVRQPVWIRGTNGVRYFGTYYKSSGSYARIRKVKA